MHVSIRSPRRSEGRFLVREKTNSALLLLDVSIRSPRRSEGRSKSVDNLAHGNTGQCFNPLPPPKRGEIAVLD